MIVFSIRDSKFKLFYKPKLSAITTNPTCWALLEPHLTMAPTPKPLHKPSSLLLPFCFLRSTPTTCTTPSRFTDSASPTRSNRPASVNAPPAHPNLEPRPLQQRVALLFLGEGPRGKRGQRGIESIERVGAEALEVWGSVLGVEREGLLDLG